MAKASGQGQPFGDRGQLRAKISDHPAFGRNVGARPRRGDAVQGEAVDQRGLTGAGGKFNPAAGVEHLPPGGFVGGSDVDAAPCGGRVRGEGCMQSLAHQVVAAVPNHERSGGSLIQRQAEDPAVRFLDHAGCRRADGEQAVEVGGIAALAVGEGGGCLSRGRLRIAGTDHR